MQPVKVLLAILLCALPASASYVQSGKQNFASGRSNTVCSPGTVTAGDLIVMVALMNTATSVTISSTRVTTWVLDQHTVSAPSNFYVYHGIATSSGVETVTVALSSGTTFDGSACAEYTNPTFNATGGTSIVTTAPIVDLVVGAFNAVGATFTMSAPMTTRQSVDDGAGNVYMLLGDRSVSTSGTYSFSCSPSATMTISDAFAPAAATANFRHRLLYQ